MSTTRPPAVAGLFYPGNPTELRQDIHRYLSEAKPPKTTPKAIVVPHAGYVYSGPVAASAFVYLESLRDTIQRVVLFGPAHRVPFVGLAVPSSDYFKTPLGDVPLDTETINALLQNHQVVAMDIAHREEHSLEVQLPFLQEILNDFKLVPIVVGQASPDDVARVINDLWGDEHTLIVISSDLSHYHSYQQAQQMDRATSDAVVNLQPEQIDYEDACGRTALNGLLVVAKQKGLHADIVDLRNSGDTAGPRDRVVGYGAYVFH